MKGSELQLQDNAKGKRDLAKLQKGAKERAIEESVDYPDAAKQFEKIRKESVKVRARLKALESKVEKLIAEKFQREMRGE